MAKMINLSDLINKANGKETNTAKPQQQEQQSRALVSVNEIGADGTQEATLESIVAAIMNIHDITIELCGKWLWVSGDTKTHKDALKGAGLRWAHKKKMWYWRAKENACYHRSKGKPMSYIRLKYGSEEIK